MHCALAVVVPKGCVCLPLVAMLSIATYPTGLLASVHLLPGPVIAFDAISKSLFLYFTCTISFTWGILIEWGSVNGKNICCCYNLFIIIIWGFGVSSSYFATSTGFVFSL